MPGKPAPAAMGASKRDEPTNPTAEPAIGFTRRPGGPRNWTRSAATAKQSGSSSKMASASQPSSHHVENPKPEYPRRSLEPQGPVVGQLTNHRPVFKVGTVRYSPTRREAGR